MHDTLAIRPVRNEADYERALEDIEKLMDARPGTPEGDELDVLSTLVEAYKSEHYPIEAPDPIGLIEFAMEQRGADPFRPRADDWLARPGVGSPDAQAGTIVVDDPQA